MKESKLTKPGWVGISVYADEAEKFCVYGPFESEEAAHRYMDSDFDGEIEKHVVELSPIAIEDTK